MFELLAVVLIIGGIWYYVHNRTKVATIVTNVENDVSNTVNNVANTISNELK